MERDREGLSCPRPRGSERANGESSEHHTRSRSGSWTCIVLRYTYLPMTIPVAIVKRMLHNHDATITSDERSDLCITTLKLRYPDQIKMSPLLAQCRPSATDGLSELVSVERKTPMYETPYYVVRCTKPRMWAKTSHSESPSPGHDFPVRRSNWLNSAMQPSTGT